MKKWHLLQLLVTIQLAEEMVKLCRTSHPGFSVFRSVTSSTLTRPSTRHKPVLSYGSISHLGLKPHLPAQTRQLQRRTAHAANATHIPAHTHLPVPTCPSSTMQSSNVRKEYIHLRYKFTQYYYTASYDHLTLSFTLSSAPLS